jgi:YD repeat-containing protein
MTPNSNLLALTHDQMSASYTYDARDLVSSVTNTESNGATRKVEQFTYTPNGWRLKQTKGNGNTVDYAYFLDGLLQHQVEKKPDATIVNEHTYTYTYDANGNQATDVSKKRNADNHAAYLNWTYTSTYDPRDRITRRVKTDTTTGATLGTETYAYDANSNITSQTVAGTTTSYTYDRNRLLSSLTAGVKASYNYDPFGRLDTITAAGQVQERNTYDGFDRLIASSKLNGATTTTNLTYDPLDRRTSETTNAGTANAKTTNLTYLGLSTQVLSEEGVAGTLTKSYQYSPWGERLSEINHTTGTTPTDAYYGYNAHTDVDEITDATGNTKATYGYTAYGTNDPAAFTGVDTPDAQNHTKDSSILTASTPTASTPAPKSTTWGFAPTTPAATAS